MLSGATCFVTPDIDICGWRFVQFSGSFSSSVPGIVNSSANFGSTTYPSSSASSITKRPFGARAVAANILANWALRRCLSLPGNLGFVSTAAFRSPVNIYLTCLAATMCSGLQSGS